MTIQRGVDQNVPRRSAYPPNVTRLLERARQHNGGIRMQMTMPGQGETGMQGFNSGSDAAKLDTVGRYVHV